MNIIPKKSAYGALLLLLSVITSCMKEEDIGIIEKSSLLRFEFPQGNNPWDKEIEKIAQEWGMYIIYKKVDSTDLNRSWTSSGFQTPIWVCQTPNDNEIKIYLDLIQKWLLGSLDKDKREDRLQLPFYLYLVNDLKDNNPNSPTHDKHVQLKQDGFDYWALSFTSEELQNELTPRMIHAVACAFSYPAMEVRFLNGEYKISPDFAPLTPDYESRIGTRYYSFEAFFNDMFGGNENMKKTAEYMYDMMVGSHEKDPQNVYTRRGFAPQVSKSFLLLTTNRQTFGAPTWMPWILTQMEFPGSPPLVFDNNPEGGSVPEIKGRVLQDFLNTVRLAMTFPEETIREMFPVDAPDPLDQKGNRIINDKYDLVVRYMKSAYNLDLPKYAAILGGE
ncbi:hypothetical protein [Sanguibacteroides justesenii]|uniref:hypothetical protein n=1 Tax=Sanguibacteroides justesenii TaxID=1547597 RepID=UPI0006967F32|nr:hypothetical protein [Sanguibacteroides justesenii]PXZ42992.1 hypothetical protein DMB45_12700 [Sanguibacteroides justesenii]